MFTDTLRSVTETSARQSRITIKTLTDMICVTFINYFLSLPFRWSFNISDCLYISLILGDQQTSYLSAALLYWIRAVVGAFDAYAKLTFLLSFCSSNGLYFASFLVNFHLHLLERLFAILAIYFSEVAWWCCCYATFLLLGV